MKTATDEPRARGESAFAYLGDGVYASFDGYHVWLKTERGGVWSKIAIEPDVYRKLCDYFDQLGIKRQGIA